MKYWHSDMSGRNWIETDETDPRKLIKKYWENECYVYDADTCGDMEVFFIFDIDGANVAYCLSYSWYIDNEPEWIIHNHHEIEEVPLSAYKFSANRDWLDLSPVSKW